MPYIKADDKCKFNPIFNTIKLADIRIENCGQLNYLITSLCLKYLGDLGEKYQTYNDIMGALTGAQLEIYRRKISSYEDLKISENGDCF